jgi:hypothetical protein
MARRGAIRSAALTLNHLFGPNHVVIRTDGKVTADLNVEWHWTNPYIVFPTPKEVATK